MIDEVTPPSRDQFRQMREERTNRRRTWVTATVMLCGLAVIGVGVWRLVDENNQTPPPPTVAGTSVTNTTASTTSEPEMSIAPPLESTTTVKVEIADPAVIERTTTTKP